MTTPIISVAIRTEHDVVAARRRARETAMLLGFDPQDQTRIATAVSEIARNAIRYAGCGMMQVLADWHGQPQKLVIRVEDQGPGIAHLKKILRGEYVSKTGMGLGISGAMRLMDRLDIATKAGAGTTVTLEKIMTGPARIDAARIAHVTEQLAQTPSQSLDDELRQQNQELLRVLGELRARQEDLSRLNTELEDTNRGVVALYAELDERAERLRSADQMKTRFLSHMSHEFRTPLNSILALCRILLDRVDGDLTPEQEKQVQFIRKSGEHLFELVNDLLDLAKVEAGKTEVKPAAFEAGALFGALRGVMKPLLTGDSVELIFEEPRDVPRLYTDEAKLSQILRNFISNALKFTEKGEVRVRARFDPSRQEVAFSVSDSGIGIAPEDQERIFDEFTQVDSARQQRVKGTGLGLPLARKLLQLLGGRVAVDSKPGEGSTFYGIVPLVYGVPPPQPPPAETIPALLLVDDEEISRYLLRQALGSLGCRILEASNGAQALSLVRRERPAAILLDLLMPEMDGFETLEALRAQEDTAAVPVVVVTSKRLTQADQKRLDGVVALSKDTLSRSDASDRISEALREAGFHTGRHRRPEGQSQ